MNKYEEILGSVAAQRLRGSLTLVEIAVENRVCLSPPPPPPSFTRQPPHLGPEWGANPERKLLRRSRTKRLENNSMRDASAHTSRGFDLKGKSYLGVRYPI